MRGYAELSLYKSKKSTQKDDDLYEFFKIKRFIVKKKKKKNRWLRIFDRFIIANENSL